MKEIDILVAALYEEWLLTHNPYEDDFEGLLYELLPNYKFGWTEKDGYFVLQIF